jgi:hypothetical protein
LRAELDAERELLSDCLECGASVLRLANSPIRYDLDRVRLHRCRRPHRQEQRGLNGSQVPAPLPAAQAGLSVRTID